MIQGIFMPVAAIIQTPFRVLFFLPSWPAFVLNGCFQLGAYADDKTRAFMIGIAAQHRHGVLRLEPRRPNLEPGDGSTIYSAYMWIGGIRCTFPLVIMLYHLKERQLKKLWAAPAWSRRI